MSMRLLLILLTIAWPMLAGAQSAAPPQNWQHLDKLSDGYMGVSSELTYEKLLKGKKSTPVIVAVIDGGVDPYHEDLKDVMWRNPGEIADNGIDDDGNGYIDDVYGWNFIGGKDGRNVHRDQLEITRLVAYYQKKFDGVSASELKGKAKKEYERYLELKETVEEQQRKAMNNYKMYKGVLESVNQVLEAIGKEEPSAEDLRNFKSDNPALIQASQILASMIEDGNTVEEVKHQIQEGIDYFDSQANYHYNVELDVRPIVGDNYENSYERYYGNNDVKGPDATHGTHVAGIIGARRHNGIGMDGIADNVLIMAVRCVPDGDERDKDVANAIIYAVDNGASIINMSFGKGYSWDKEAVDKAVRYAEKHDVLLIHAAGNSGQNNDEEDNFPNDTYARRGLFGPKKAKNWIEVGALSWKGGQEAVASFSNYGKKNVDLFAPGVAIYSTTPDDTYQKLQGTSMAAPVVAGVAAMLRSYYPDLSAAQVKDILMSTTVRSQDMNMVKKPGSDGELVPFTDLCVTGGVVNAFEAVKKAETVKGKKKHKKGKRGVAPASVGKPNRA
ncbi:MAG: peptidase S8 [Saprospiraceae bacterium]|nr:MAG: peptidase S8 [Saprospiraceae bacterium]